MATLAPSASVVTAAQVFHPDCIQTKKEETL